MIWVQAAKAAGFGLLAEMALGILYGIVVAIFGGPLSLSIIWIIFILTYLFTGFIAARGSETPLTAAGMAGIFLSLFSLLNTSLFFGGLFSPPLFAIGLVVTFGLSMLGAVLYRLLVWRNKQPVEVVSGVDSVEG